MKRHLMRSLLMILSLAAWQIGANEDGVATSSDSSGLLGSSVDVGEEREPGADGTIGGGTTGPLRCPRVRTP